MNPGRFFMPNMMMNYRYGFAPQMIGINSIAPKNIGLLGRLGSGIKSFNWTNLLNGASKTLNVMNQTIPLIRQAKPMVDNMKSMIKLAKAFTNETNNSKINKKKVENYMYNKNNINNEENNNYINNNYPTFFI